mmetsp:Transcript_10455/g.12724  ORF Transcript_10455/g.12724 Transcript_10455/m.12724 type:complete len:176 (-) Transcript_10455:150-677(-)
MALATQVYPIVTSTEKNLAIAQARDFANYAAAQENPDSILVQAVRDDSHQDVDEDSLPQEFATGKVAKPPVYIRFSRWIRKKLHLRRDVYGYDRQQDAGEAMQSLQNDSLRKKSQCEYIRDGINNGAAVMILVTMVLLALLLVVYYFKSGTNSVSGGSGHSDSDHDSHSNDAVRR